MKTFFLPIEPLPCPRPRIVVRGRFPSAYYPASYTKWKDQAQRLIEDARDAECIDTVSEPLRVYIENVCPRPKTTKLAHPKPDVDNYAKSVMDAMTKAGVWDDDCQVVELRVTKRWTLGDFDKPGIHITLLPLEDA